MSIRDCFKTCFCYSCGQKYHPLGIARHRASHREKKELCRISYSDGTVKVHDYRETKNRG